jgi:hypothetical protein
MRSHKSLIAKRQQLLARLPPLSEVLRGSFFVRRRCCGKPGCRCNRTRGHRTAYVAVTFKDGSTEQIALPRELEPVARRWVGNYQRWWNSVEDISRINRELLRRRMVEPPD